MLFEPFKTLRSRTIVLPQENIDTDQIIPARFLTTTSREGLGAAAFYDWRYDADGGPRNSSIFNSVDPREYRILVAGSNFGCGSSREHAPWALYDFGFRAVIGSAIADIFKSNAFQNGLLPVELSEAAVRVLMDRAIGSPGHDVTVDLESGRVTDSEGFDAPFEVDPFRRECLLQGLDDIDLTLRHEDRIRAYEAARAAAR